MAHESPCVWPGDYISSANAEDQIQPIYVLGLCINYSVCQTTFFGTRSQSWQILEIFVSSEWLLVCKLNLYWEVILYINLLRMKTSCRIINLLILAKAVFINHCGRNAFLIFYNEWALSQHFSKGAKTKSLGYNFLNQEHHKVNTGHQPRQLDFPKMKPLKCFVLCL